MLRKIIACVDGSGSTTSVINWASWLSLELDSPLLLLHVLDQTTHPKGQDLSGSIGLGSRENLLAELAKIDAERNRLALELGKKLLSSAKIEAEKQCKQPVSTMQRHGNLVETLKELEDQTRLLVIGRLGQQTDSDISQIGGQVENIIRSIKRPVLVAQSISETPKQVLIAFDGSHTSQNVLAMALKSPLLTNRICHIVKVGEDSDGELEKARLLMEQAGHDVRTALLQGEVDRCLFSYIREHQIELMVLGAYGHSRIRQFLIGSNTTKILYQSRIPLLFLR